MNRSVLTDGLMKLKKIHKKYLKKQKQLNTENTNCSLTKLKGIYVLYKPFECHCNHDIVMS